MTNLWRDVRFAIRLLTQRPAFTAVIVLTLALGIGANTAIFSIVNGLLFDRVPFAEPDGLFYITEKSKQFPRMSVSYPNFLDWLQRNRTFEAMAAHCYADFNLTGMEKPERLRTLKTSASLFSLLRSKPLLGRTFTAEEDQIGGPKVLVVSHGFWQRRLGGRVDAVGTTLTLDGEPWEVIGVMPAGFAYPVFTTPIELWQPIGQFSEPWLEARGNHPGIRVTARLAPGATAQTAQADMDRIAAELATEYPDSNTGNGVNVALLNEVIVEDVRPALLVLSAAVGLVLLIACVNVANLLLARGAARAQEMAVRSALGASRWQVARQLLCESLLLAVAGGAGGVFVAWAGLRALMATLASDRMPITSHVGIEPGVLLFTLAVAVATGMVFGLAPIFQASRQRLVDTLKDAAKGSSGLDRRRLRSGLVIGEMALALVLLVGAVLFLRTLHALVTADPGFDATRVLKFDLDGVAREARIQIYQPSAQSQFSIATVVVKAEGDPLALRGPVEGAVRGLDGDLPIADLGSLEDALARAVITERLSATLLTVFAVLALVLSAVGIYGVVAYSVSQRQREIGIRMALGAGRPDVVRLVVGQSLRLVVGGIALGLGLVLLAAPLVRDQLFGVGPRDPATLIAIPALLALIALLACAIPARRASRVEPVVALHHE